MKEYPKIESLYDRDEKTHKFIEGQWRHPAFDYLSDVLWRWTEKVDGTNVRIMWDGETLRFGGRTDNAQMPTFLLHYLQQIVTRESITKVFDGPVCLYGEGYGAKIQKGGKYKAVGPDFALFDVLVGDWWLRWKDVEDVADKLMIGRVPVVNEARIAWAQAHVCDGYQSAWGDFLAEGFVGRPLVDLFDRQGKRIMVKLKTRDFA